MSCFLNRLLKKIKLKNATKAPSHQKWHQGFGVDFGVRRMTVWCIGDLVAKRIFIDLGFKTEMRHQFILIT